MKRTLAILLFAVLSLQVSDLRAKNKAVSKSDLKAVREVIDRQGKEGTRVRIKTSEGNITLMLYYDVPGHRDNFLKNIDNGVYTGVIFHRVIRDFMIQSGDPTSKYAMATSSYGANDAGREIPAEISDKYFHHQGALAAARTPDQINPEKNSSGSQFYIVQGTPVSDLTLDELEQYNGSQIPQERRNVYKILGGVPHLDGDYTVFGRVLKGQEVVRKISEMKTDYNNRPHRDVYIIKINYSR